MPPAATRSALVGSSLIVTVTSPLGTSLRRATSSSVTTSRITPVNIATPRRISPIVGPYSWIPENIMNASDISPAVMNVMPRPFRPSGTCE